MRTYLRVHAHVHRYTWAHSHADTYAGGWTNTLPLAHTCDPEAHHRRPCSFSVPLGSEAQVLVRTQGKMRQRDTGDPSLFLLFGPDWGSWQPRLPGTTRRPPQAEALPCPPQSPASVSSLTAPGDPSGAVHGGRGPSHKAQFPALSCEAQGFIGLNPRRQSRCMVCLCVECMCVHVCCVSVYTRVCAFGTGRAGFPTLSQSKSPFPSQDWGFTNEFATGFYCSQTYKD